MAQITIFVLADDAADDVPADLEAALRARLEEVYVGPDAEPYALRVLGVDVEDE